MSLPPNYCRVALVGASSLRGKDLAAALEERGFPSTDVRLLDDEVIDGTLSEAGGEPVVIQGIDEESFEGVRFAFFAGAANLTRRHRPQASHAGTTVIDLSGAIAEDPGAVPWIPGLRKLLPPPRTANGKLFYALPAPAIIACTLAAALREFEPQRMALTVFQPVSERGPEGIETLESQTVNLLSMKPIATGAFDAQVAFNLLASYGEEGRPGLDETCAAAARDVKAYLADRMSAPALQFIHAPVFYGHAFSVYVETAKPREVGEVERALEGAGVKVATSPVDSPSNVSVAGESVIQLAPVERDPNVPTGLWMWGAADNLRLATANAISIAETLLAS